MRPQLGLLSATICFMASQVASAAVFSSDWKSPGDGLLTYDDVSGREWLDLELTQLSKFPSNSYSQYFAKIRAQTLPGGMFEGFQLADRSALTALAQSAGIETANLSFSNEAATRRLISLVGATDSSRISPFAVEEYSFGRLLGSPTPDSGLLMVLPNGTGTSGFAGAIFGGGPVTEATQGVWLFRQIPEPRVRILILTAAIVLTRIRRPHGTIRTAERDSLTQS